MSLQLGVERVFLERKSEILPLTGLRGVAVLIVILGHYLIWCAPYDGNQTPQFIIRACSTTDAGMTLFFTLSGFVIAYNYLGFDWHGRPLGSAIDFVYLRLSRLYPAYLLFFLIAVRRIPADYPLKASILNFFSMQSWYPLKIDGVLPFAGGYAINWSISTEIGMYLIFVGWVALCSRFRAKRWLALWLSGIVIVILGLAAAFYADHLAAFLNRLPIASQPTIPTDMAMWFFYLSPFFRFVDFLFGSPQRW